MGLPVRSSLDTTCLPVNCKATASLERIRIHVNAGASEPRDARKLKASRALELLSGNSVKNDPTAHLLALVCQCAMPTKSKATFSSALTSYSLSSRPCFDFALLFQL